jgi:Apea-like HEPN
MMNVAPTVVLVLDRPVRLAVSTSEDPGAEMMEPSKSEEVWKQVQRAGDLLALAALLGIDRSDRIPMAGVWVVHHAPVLGASGIHGVFPRGARARTAMFFVDPPARTGGDPLSDEEQRELHEWAARVERHHDPLIDVAVTRILSAFLERDEAQDALIDAVIALENLFGHRQATEVTLRVTTAATLLIEPDPTKREALQRQLKTVHKARSKVLHGGTTPRSPSAETRRSTLRFGR